jgi:hypothetical protein
MDCGSPAPGINFVGFDEQSLDTVIIRRFEKYSGGNRLMDSSVLCLPDNGRYSFNGDTARSMGWKKTDITPFPLSLRIEFDYEVYLPSAGRTFKINNIVEEKTKEKYECPNCTMVKRFCINPIKTMTIDNVTIQVNDYIWDIFLKK